MVAIKIFLFCFLLALVTSEETTSSDKPAEPVFLKKLANRNNGDRYLMFFSQSDGQFRYERGFFRRLSEDDPPIWVVTGHYGYRSPEGQLFSYKYTADEKGYRQEPEPNGEEALAAVVNRIDPKTLISLVG
ncbi:uncharacterized protein LOC129758053 [Uranotaenia lowii]|uniref:uncharacterized protein LOC129758053 n=1 Tax=Uranotaenia lowii TaxID=190385 RepID=UPI002479601C|nr:uncharacterized protein LOC129758053 [Uranotaenia lowii]